MPITFTKYPTRSRLFVSISGGNPISSRSVSLSAKTMRFYRIVMRSASLIRYFLSAALRLKLSGALGQGERVWVMAKVKGEGKIADDDVIERYLLLSTGHDGKTAVQVRFTPIRVVCQNTLMWATQSGRDFAKIYHVPGMQRELYGVQEKRSQRSSKNLAQWSVASLEWSSSLWTRRSWRATYRRSSRLQHEGRANRTHPTKRPLPEFRQIRARSAGNFESGRGNKNKAVAGSLWAAYNGVIEFLDHQKPYRDRWHRLSSLWFGDEQKIKQRALDEATAMLPA